MTYQQELKSWLAPSSVPTSSSPSIGSPAPSIPNLPNTSGRPLLVTFLRHCGCPFAEKTFLSLRSHASSHPNITFVAVSHSDKAATDKWLESVGGADQVEVIVDSERKIYAEWGLGISSFWHVLNPQGMWNAFKLGKEEGVWNRPTESGSRWQTGGTFAVDGAGIVRWGQAAPGADWIPDLDQAIKAIER